MTYKFDCDIAYCPYCGQEFTEAEWENWRCVCNIECPNCNKVFRYQRTLHGCNPLCSMRCETDVNWLEDKKKMGIYEDKENRLFVKCYFFIRNQIFSMGNCKHCGRQMTSDCLQKETGICYVCRNCKKDCPYHYHGAYCSYCDDEYCSKCMTREGAN